MIEVSIDKKPIENYNPTAQVKLELTEFELIELFTVDELGCIDIHEEMVYSQEDIGGTIGKHFTDVLGF